MLRYIVCTIFCDNIRTITLAPNNKQLEGKFHLHTFTHMLHLASSHSIQGCGTTNGCYEHCMYVGHKGQDDDPLIWNTLLDGNMLKY